ncbi:hypothetical protein [Streptomyces sp. SPB074]|uniref:hypothetical protein n=1 Tax=Streptomyces sp. (strain SPB074) TaxID=465543 RepID=UPI00017F279B|nr:hypothetical protein [Streptomyces sp. SPB074]EDY44602.1 hypothetical protein SSBG_02564 [Streptomyces sp. SPB074]
MTKRKTAEEEPEPSPLAGGCVVAGLTLGAGAGLWAASPAAAILALWGGGTALVWRHARTRMSDSSATPLPGEDPSPEDDEAGHSDAPRISVERRAGMLIIKDLSEQRRYEVP